MDMVEIPTEYILVFFTAVFVPLFLYLMKNITKMSEIETRIAQIEGIVLTQKEQGISISDMKSDIRVLRLRMDNAEVEIRGSDVGSPRIDYEKDGKDNRK